jgi:hypothetical protein
MQLVLFVILLLFQVRSYLHLSLETGLLDAIIAISSYYKRG